MIRWILYCVAFGLSALIAHFSVLHALPNYVMDRVQNRLADGGVSAYQWVASPRQTPETQTVVRPSPDLSYAICRFDVRDGPVLITAPGWDGYGSLSVFDERTNNVFVASLDGEGAGVTLVSELGRHVDKPPLDGTNEVTILKGLGLALIRRLAPDALLHGEARDLVQSAVCQQTSWP